MKKKLAFDRAMTKQDLVTDLKMLGVKEGETLNVKASMKSIGFVEGGAKTLIDALVEAVGPKGTIITDSFVSCYRLPLDKKSQAIVTDSNTVSYAGALANAMIADPRSVRSRHPIQKFSAIGKKANELMMRHDETRGAYDPLDWITFEGGKNLKIGTDEKVIGVGTTHVVICKLGIRDFRPRMGVNYRKEDGSVWFFERNWPGGGCGRGFNNFIEVYRERGAIIHEGLIGRAPSKITDMKMTHDIEMEILSKTPNFFLCNEPSCGPCRLGFPFSKGSRTIVLWGRIKKDWQKCNELGFFNVIKEKGIRGLIRALR